MRFTRIALPLKTRKRQTRGNTVFAFFDAIS